jgi:hypothetical protein
MELRIQLLKAHSKENCNIIVAWVGSNQKNFNELFALFMGNENRLVQMSSWPLSYCVEANPNLVQKHIASLLKNIKRQAQHEAVKRHTLRMLQFVEIPKKYQGVVMNMCFDFIQNIAEKPTTKVFSLAILENLIKLYPEITDELRLILETQIPYESAGFKSRAKKMLSKLHLIFLFFT